MCNSMTKTLQKLFRDSNYYAQATMYPKWHCYWCMFCSKISMHTASRTAPTEVTYLLQTSQYYSTVSCITWDYITYRNRLGHGGGISPAFSRRFSHKHPAMGAVFTNIICLHLIAARWCSAQRRCDRDGRRRRRRRRRQRRGRAAY